MRPFQRVAFEQLPELPRLPHDYASTTAHTLEMQSRPFGSLKIHYREHGRGPTLLLVHGLMTTSYSWRYVYAPLGEHFRIIAPDLPGAGRSDKPAAESYSAAALAEWIGEFQRALGIHGCKTVGNSLGGLLCMRLAYRDEHAFERLVNIHSPAFPDVRYRALRSALAVPGAARLLNRFIRRDPLRWAWKNVHYYDETLKSLEEAREYGAPLTTKEGATAFIRYLSEAMASDGFDDFEAELLARRGQPFPMPLLLLYSRMDPLVKPANGERLHALIQGSQLSWIEDSSHFAHIDTPAAVVRELLAFLR